MNGSLPIDVLGLSQKESLKVFLELLRDVLRDVDVELVGEMAVDLFRMYKKMKLAPERLVRLKEREDRWYKSLAGGRPDYDMYKDDEYLAEVWACWSVYSRSYLKNIARKGSLTNGRSILDDLRDVDVITDLGCGCGFTTASLKQLFPSAEVFGTNIEGSDQFKLAKAVGDVVGFDVSPEPPAKTDGLVFASEYFEHFVAPLEHLRYVLDVTKPSAMLVANAFSGRAVGHFDMYDVGEENRGFGFKSGKKEGRFVQAEFAKIMRCKGYVLMDTCLWNNRPAYWRRQG